MDFSLDHKEKIEKRIVEIITTSLEKDTAFEAEIPIIAQFVLESLNQVATNDQLIEFLSELSGRWPIFKDIEFIEQSQLRKQEEQDVAQDVASLAKSGKIEDALELAKKANQ